MSQMYPSADDYQSALEPARLAKHLRSDNPLLARVAGGVLQVPKGSPYSHVANGFFTYIYRIKAEQGGEFALRCPRSQFPKDSAARYQALARFLQATPNAAVYLATADHFDDALFVSVQLQGRWFPVQVMEWVSGKTLIETVAEMVRTNDKKGLNALADAWERLLIDMKSHGVIHADLHPENVIVSPGNRLRLVDYDTLIAPGFTPDATSAGGMTTYFHPSYARNQESRPATPYLDDFGAINILLSLRALAVNPARRKSSDYLLFSDDDIETPTTSTLFFDLLHCSNTRTVELANAFFEECCSPDETGNLRVEHFLPVTPKFLPWGNGTAGVTPQVTTPSAGSPPGTRRTYEFTAPNMDDFSTSKTKPSRRVVIDDYKPQ